MINTDNTFRTKNKITGDFIKTDLVISTADDVNLAVANATAASNDFGHLSLSKRADFLDTIASEIENLGKSLIDLASAESGLPEGRITGERGRTCGQLRMFANVLRDGSYLEIAIDTADSSRQPAPKPDTRLMLKPIGPVVVFGASNFPLAFSTAGGDTASALASGCPVIVKGHSLHAGTSSLVASAIASAISKCNLPSGVFSHLLGSGEVVGQALVKHPGVKAVGFTGSYKAGMILHSLAQERKEPIPVFAEMGSVNPVFLNESALTTDAEGWANKFASSFTLGAGQFCTKPGFLIAVKSPNLVKFEEALISVTEQINAQPMLGENICSSYYSGLESLKRVPNVDILVSSEKIKENEGAPQVLKCKGKDVLSSESLKEEVFGPWALIVECESEEEVKEVLASIGGQLTATLITTEEDKANSEWVEVLAAISGRVSINTVPTGVEVNHSMQHGGPFPAATDSRFTSVGAGSIRRFIRPVCYQNIPNQFLPEVLKDENPLNILRKVNGQWTKEKL